MQETEPENIKNHYIFKKQNYTHTILLKLQIFEQKNVN